MRYVYHVIHFACQGRSQTYILLKQSFLDIESNLLMWSSLLRDHLSKAATFSGFLVPKYSANEPVLRGHLS